MNFKVIVGSCYTNTKVFCFLIIKYPSMPDLPNESTALDHILLEHLARINTLGIKLEKEFPNSASVMATTSQHPDTQFSKA